MIRILSLRRLMAQSPSGFALTWLNNPEKSIPGQGKPKL